MKKIKINEGIYTIELENNDEPIHWDASFSKHCDLVELIIPDGATTIKDKGFIYCTNLKKINLPSSIKFLGDSLFYGTYELIEINYNGTSEEFKELAKHRKVIRPIQVPGNYDVQPYCNTQGTYYEDREVIEYFDNFCAKCEVKCKDGIILKYGYRK